ncbi:MAG: noncanonical pyrimidine nucleotidase, YjjG family [Bacteroidetes bacterium]|nr:noncanonical pyrimidine nucleotidase, YjjG family [Bacteroidota bacterium]
MIKKRYKQIFIDLDRTLWDFDKSALKTFQDIYHNYHLKEFGILSLEIFLKSYNKHNDILWNYYRKGEIKKEVLSIKRFQLTLDEFKIDDLFLASRIANDYVTKSPLNVVLFPYTHEILAYLKKKYQLHLITNGFEEVQQVKLDSAKLRKYFTEIITSEKAGSKKPEAQIFEYAFDKTGADATESLMVGDDLAVDIVGARSVGMDQLYVNYNGTQHKENITFEVHSLKEIEGIL